MGDVSWETNLKLKKPHQRMPITESVASVKIKINSIFETTDSNHMQFDCSPHKFGSSEWRNVSSFIFYLIKIEKNE